MLTPDENMDYKHMQFDYLLQRNVIQKFPLMNGIFTRSFFSGKLPFHVFRFV